MTIRRNLFGRETSEKTDSEKFVRKQLSEIQQNVKNRWNFDFRTEKPLPGRWKWENDASNGSVGGGKYGSNKQISSGWKK